MQGIVLGRCLFRSQGKPSQPTLQSRQWLWGCTCPGLPTPTHTRAATEKQRLMFSDRFFFYILKTKSTSLLQVTPQTNKQKIRLNKIYSEYTQQTSVCALNTVCYCGTNLKQTICKCSGRWGEAQVLTLWSLGRQDGRSERKGKSISFFLILSI